MEAGSGRVRGAVLCGGASVRMGRDKALLRLDGRTLLERALASLSGVCDEVVLCCGKEPRYAELGHELVLDNLPGGGPLAGVEAALARLAPGETLAVLAVDLPHAGPPVLRRLLLELVQSGRHAALARSPRGLEPLVSVWRAEALEGVRGALARGERRMVAPFQGLSDHGTLLVQEVCFDEGFAPRAFDNLNTPLDWERAALETGGGDDIHRRPRNST